jgi:hypothetical protein
VYRLRLRSSLRKWKKGDCPLSPFVHLSIGTHSQSQEGDILLSEQLMNPLEIDHAVDSMKTELEEFRERAKAELVSIKETILAGLKK